MLDTDSQIELRIVFQNQSKISLLWSLKFIIIETRIKNISELFLFFTNWSKILPYRQFGSIVL